MAMPDTGDLLIILFICFLVFVAGKIPSLADGLARLLRR